MTMDVGEIFVAQHFPYHVTVLGQHARLLGFRNGPAAVIGVFRRGNVVTEYMVRYADAPLSDRRVPAACVYDPDEAPDFVILFPTTRRREPAAQQGAIA